MRRHTIRFTLFVTYAVIILVFFTALIAYSGMNESRKLSDQMFRVLRQNAQSLASSMDSELSQMNMVSMNVCYSNLVKQQFAQYLSVKAEQKPTESISSVKVLSELLTSIIGPNRPVDQVNLYGMDGGMVATGLDNRQYETNAADQVWYQALLVSDGNRVVAYTGEDPALSKYYTDPDGKRFLTLARQYIDKLWIPQGFVEVKSSARRVLGAVLNYTSVYGEQVAVFDENGAVILPRESGLAPLWPALSEGGFPQDVTQVRLGAEAGYALCVPSALSGFQTVLFILQSQTSAPMLDYLRNTLGIGLGMMVFALALAYLAAKHFTDPIQSICREVSSYALSQPVKREPFRTRVAELSALYESFAQMQTKIESGVQRQLALQEQEMQSRMLALLAQMNPHFLYNSLSALQSMADEGMRDEIIQMCQAMSRILRYISSDNGPLVPLREELGCTEDFLQCMVLRYQGDLRYEIDVPVALDAVCVPKLCVQLLCENAVKFATQERPPWRMRITGSVSGDRYELSIRDNGPGFSQEVLDTINRAIRSIDETGLLPSLSIGGMGLLNIYMRYKLLYQRDIIFLISNNAEGGACVTIGGYYESLSGADRG